MRVASVALLLLGVSLATLKANEVAIDDLQPYQMMRSLQNLQDRIADGDHAVLPMQTKLLTMVDTRLRAASAEEFKDRRNVYALLIYAMSGGNPRTAAELLPMIDPQIASPDLIEGIRANAEGRPGAAIPILLKFNPMTLAPEIGAPLALVMGNLIGSVDKVQAAKYLDMARLLAPGTLIEEAALRRTLDLSLQTNDPDRFKNAATEYVRRFVLSPYAGQFASGFIEGAMKFESQIPFADIADMAHGMGAQRRDYIFLELARLAAIDGKSDLARLASDAVNAREQAPLEREAMRAQLYASIGSVTMENVDETMASLRAIDPEKLDGGDRRLLDAALNVATAMLAPPPPSAIMPVELPQTEIVDEASSASLPQDVSSNASVTRSRAALADIDRLLEGK